jgi:hypothetical protein
MRGPVHALEHARQAMQGKYKSCQIMDRWIRLSVKRENTYVWTTEFGGALLSPACSPATMPPNCENVKFGGKRDKPLSVTAAGVNGERTPCKRCGVSSVRCGGDPMSYCAAIKRLAASPYAGWNARRMNLLLLVRRILGGAGIFLAFSLCFAQSDLSQAKYMVERPVHRLALLLANWDYPSGALTGTENDQKKLTAELKALGFSVYTYSNFRNQEELLNEAVNPFLDKVSFGDFAVIYYTGHGFAYGEKNFPVPTRLPASIRSSDFFNYFVSAEELQEKLRVRQAGISLVLLDACRTFGGLSIIGSDGSPPEIPKGGLKYPSLRMSTNMSLAYAAEPGQVAIIKGDSSLFTKSLIEELHAGTTEYDALKRGVINRVLNESNEQQQPWFSESATAVIRFEETASTLSTDKTSWTNALASGSTDAVKSYLRSFPTSRFAYSAREWLRDNPDGKPSDSVGIPAAAVAQLWQTPSAGGRMSIVSGAFRSAHVAALSAQATSAARAMLVNPITAGRVNATETARWMLASQRVSADRPVVVRDGPVSTANVVGVLPKDFTFTADAAHVDSQGRAWVRTSIPSVDEPVFGEAPPATSKRVDIGRPAAEGLLHADESSDAVLVKPLDLYKLVASVGEGASSITWASVETGTLECDMKKADCRRRSDMQQLRSLHAQALIAAAGVSRQRITVLQKVEGVPETSVRVRFFAGGTQ